MDLRAWSGGQAVLRNELLTARIILEGYAVQVVFIAL